MFSHALFRYANLIDDIANNKVEDTFPITIGLVNDNNGTIVVLIPKYRTDTDEFNYYISQILAAIEPTCTKFS